MMIVRDDDESEFCSKGSLMLCYEIMLQNMKWNNFGILMKNAILI